MSEAAAEKWWAEGGRRVDVRGGSLEVDANAAEGDDGGVCTVWYRPHLPSDVRVEFDARVIQSDIGANNINLFLSYSDPAGTGLYQTKAGRSDGAYAKYHNLSGYIFTFLSDRHGEAPPAKDGLPAARMRIRRCPGFRLLAETYGYQCRPETAYHISIAIEGGLLTFDVDDTLKMQASDPEPLTGGLLGFRTFRTHLIWSNITVDGSRIFS